jgi:hypothetical protein
VGEVERHIEALERRFAALGDDPSYRHRLDWYTRAMCHVGIFTPSERREAAERLAAGCPTLADTARTANIAKKHPELGPKPPPTPQEIEAARRRIAESSAQAMRTGYEPHIEEARGLVADFNAWAARYGEKPIDWP